MCRFKSCPQPYDITETFGMDTPEGHCNVQVNIRGGMDCDGGGCYHYQDRMVTDAPENMQLTDDEILDKLDEDISEFIRNEIDY